MYEEIVTLFVNAAKNDLPGLIESIIAVLTIVPAIIAFLIKVAGFTYSEEMDRIFLTKRQQRNNYIYENIMTTILIAAAIIVLVKTEELYVFWTLTTMVIGGVIIIWGLAFSFKIIPCCRIAKIVISIIVVIGLLNIR